MRNRWIEVALLCGAFGCSSSTPATPATSDSGADARGSNACASAGSHFTVDLKDGRCKSDGTTTNVGAPCTAANPAVCGTDQNASCLDVVTDDYPGGYCNVDPCSELDGHLCPVGASCVQLNGENGQCFKDCSGDTDCRNKEGYFCLDMTNDRPDSGHACSDPQTAACWHSGASHKVCVKHTLICPNGASDCPSLFPSCVLPDGGHFAPPAPDAAVSGSADDGAVDDAAPIVAPPTPTCAM